MLFNTIDFVIFFVCILTIITIIKNRNFYLIFIVLVSYFFFYYSNNFLISLLIFSTILDFYIGKEIFNSTSKSRKKNLLIISIVGNLGLLGFFKYTNFAISEFNKIFEIFGLENLEMMEIILPIGISFYTFQTLSYSIDIYRNQLTPCKSFREFAMFVAFFPQLVAGPILRASQFIPQIREKFSGSGQLSFIQRIIENSNLKLGITLMSFGFFKKMFFADNIAPMVDQIFSNPIGYDSFGIILATIGFGIQLYCDFSGYSDIAIGAALILGFKVPKNFNFPFFAKSPAEFWRRWHISLSTWVRDYLFLPLVFKNRKSSVRVFASVIITMFLIGLWHGAGINFIIFGLMHGMYVGIEGLLRSKFKIFRKQISKNRWIKILSIIGTQYLVLLSFLAFRIHDLNELSIALQKFIFLDITTQVFDTLSENKLPVLLMILFVIVHYISYKKQNMVEIIAGFNLKYWSVFLIIVLTSIIFFYDANPRDFIYFRF